MKKKLFTIVILIMSTFVGLSAQNSQFHVGLGFPNGRFGDDDKSSSKSGYAAMGFNIGYKYYKPLTAPNLSFVFTIDAFYNDLQGDRKDYWEDKYSDVDFTFSKYINAPVTVGLNYFFPLTETVKVYGEGGLGANFSWMTPEVLEYSSVEVKTTHTVAFGFTYGIEGGILIQDKYTIGLRYNQLGTYKYKYKMTTESGSNKNTDKGKLDKQPISILSLTAGIKF